MAHRQHSHDSHTMHRIKGIMRPCNTIYRDACGRHSLCGSKKVLVQQKMMPGRAQASKTGFQGEVRLPFPTFANEDWAAAFASQRYGGTCFNDPEPPPQPTNTHTHINIHLFFFHFPSIITGSLSLSLSLFVSCLLFTDLKGNTGSKISRERSRCPSGVRLCSGTALGSSTWWMRTVK